MQAENKQGGPGRILVVDDDPTLAQLLVEALRAEGYALSNAHSAKEALQQLADGSYDLVLADIGLPDRSGLELLLEIRCLSEAPDVVMVTAEAEAKSAVRALRGGAADYIIKPFDLEELQIIVARVLQQRTLQDENEAYRSLLEQRVDESSRRLKAQDQEVERLQGALQRSYQDTLLAMVAALDLRDNETRGHSMRVAEYATLVGEQMQLGPEDLLAVRWGAILHDVGKIGIPDAILRKRGQLDEREQSVMRLHPEMGHRMLRHLGFLNPALDVVLHHHERWDGRGYPQGLQGESIPLAARIFAVVDCFDAMTSDRPYRPACSLERARQEIMTQAGTQFDPVVAKVMADIPLATWRGIRERMSTSVSAEPSREYMRRMMHQIA